MNLTERQELLQLNFFYLVWTRYLDTLTLVASTHTYLQTIAL